MRSENGLENVVAAETMLSHVDGEAGELVICGRTLDELAARYTFEEVVSLMLTDQFAELPEDMSSALADARCDVFERMPNLEGLSRRPIMDGVQALLATLPDESDLHTALKLIAAPAVFTAALIRVRDNKQPVPPSPEHAHALDILAMAGLPAGRTAEMALDRYLMTVVDHGLNASTFTARVVASTGSGLTSSALAALGALKGPLHGGAPGPVLDMLDAIGEPENAAGWIHGRLDSGERLMGFGHRIYRVRDPRADALAGAVDLLRFDKVEAARRLELAQAVEKASLEALAARKPDRPIETNVEYYTAMLLEALGFPRDSFTCVFAMGRTTGWIAHSREQARTGRLIRPQSRYVGPMPRRAA